MPEKDEQFALALVEFYKSFLGDTADSVRRLIKIQEKFPDGYKKLIEIQKDPSMLLELTKEVDEESARIIIEMFVKTSVLSKKTIGLFDLSVIEKKEFVDELEEFKNYMDKYINELKKIKEKKKK